MLDRQEKDRRPKPALELPTELPSGIITYTEEETRDYVAFIERIKKKSGIDLAQYKEAQMRRRLNTLRMKLGFETFAAFADAMNKDVQIYHEFLDRMTINVSEFWRNPSRWHTLKDQIIPELLKDSKRLKCWSAACSTGEEPYSLAMILDDAGLLTQSTIIATDIDDNVLARAKEGLYLERSFKDVPPPFKTRYASQSGEMLRIQDQLKRGIQFRKHNLLTDAFDTQHDLIICRNVMIYFTEEAKQELYMRFSQALRPGGVLFVGSTEQIFNPSQYNLESLETFFYRKK
ncbi:MAG: protein-glutamate O-methyltransferase CheR [Paenibacillus sp.]|uniref:protein-glutamate O-methyltransferase n=1 Tax=Paenibacillus aquistagni TaxID=1852522 RepID=A0A1X7JGY5_9BACL|nr:protein-glutamate O-methyltransferase CheR [Paenibacillus aquistagni]MBR2569317.1 protein-glutamate O-methyltransferase CheR [Paenibacillus sp.]SMG26811.1 chemotaxis protein methyltransferase CheR [Paenibacillus aquistagni]